MTHIDRSSQASPLPSLNENALIDAKVMVQMFVAAMLPVAYNSPIIQANADTVVEKQGTEVCGLVGIVGLSMIHMVVSICKVSLFSYIGFCH